MSSDFIENYHLAMSHFSADDFEKFFEMAGISDQSMRTIGKDILGVAGAHYYSQLAQFAASNTRGETIKHLRRAQKASRDLADSLEHVMMDRTASGALMDAGIALGRDMKSDPVANQDALSVLSAIFPIDADGKGFREEGLQKALIALAGGLHSIEEDAIPKARRGRRAALVPWLQIVCFYWVEATGSIPTLGHYYRETGDYSSVSLAALSFAAERLDRELSSSVVADGLKGALKELEENPILPLILLSSSIPMLVASNAAQSDDETLVNWLGAPSDIFAEFRKADAPEAGPTREKATLSEQEFFESIKSSEGGILLLQAVMAMKRK